MFKCFFNETAEEECQFLRSTSYNKVLDKRQKIVWFEYDRTANEIYRGFLDLPLQDKFTMKLSS